MAIGWTWKGRRWVTYSFIIEQTTLALIYEINLSYNTVFSNQIEQSYLIRLSSLICNRTPEHTIHCMLKKTGYVLKQLATKIQTLGCITKTLLTSSISLLLPEICEIPESNWDSPLQFSQVGRGYHGHRRTAPSEISAAMTHESVMDLSTSRIHTQYS